MIPDYKRIFCDIISRKFPEKEQKCSPLLNKKNLSVRDIVELNEIIFGASDKQTTLDNQRHRSYSRSDILQMLDYQKKHKLNNSQLAKHFKLSRNTVAKWKKMFLV